MRKKPKLFSPYHSLFLAKTSREDGKKRTWDLQLPWLLYSHFLLLIYCCYYPYLLYTTTTVVRDRQTGFFVFESNACEKTRLQFLIYYLLLYLAKSFFSYILMSWWLLLLLKPCTLLNEDKLRLFSLLFFWMNLMLRRYCSDDWREC